MKSIFTIIFILSSFLVQAQTTSGEVLDAITGEKIIGASVKLLNTGKGAITDTKGFFSLEGEGTLQVSFIGYKTFQIETNGEILQIEITPETTILQGIEIVGRAAKDYNSEYSFSATKIGIKNKELPQGLSTITKELITDRQAFQLADAVKIASGVLPSSNYNQYNIRGISQNEEGQIINGMRTRQYYFLQPLTTNIERVEVLKGPASVTFSSVDPGGSINMVTKKPLAVDRKEVSMAVGSFSTFRGTLDFTGPLNKSKTLLYRFNGAIQKARSFRDLVQNNAVLVSPSISYLPNSKTSINAEMIFNNGTGTLDRGQPIFGAVAGVTDLNSTPQSLNLGSPTDYFKSNEIIITGNLSHKFSDKISFNTRYMKQSWTEDLQEHRTTNAFAPDITNTPVTSLAVMQFVQRQQYWNVDNLNAYFNFDFDLGKLENRLLVGYDLQSWHKVIGGGQNAARGYLLNDGSVASSFVLENADDYQTVTVDDKILPRPNVPYFDLANPSYTIRNVSDYTLNVNIAVPTALTTTNAIYLQEQLKFGKFSALLSLRNEWFKDITNYETANEQSFTNTALIPRIGLTFEATKDINIYATYLEGYQPQSNTVTLMPSTGAFFWDPNSPARFKPLISELKELGAKAEFFDKRISMNMAIYEINQENILMNANDPTQPDLLVQRGADRSRGFEWDIAGYITPDWQINASYSFIDAVIMNDANEALIGERKENTAKNSGNIWTRYNFSPKSQLKSLGIGFGLQYVGERVPWFTRDFMVPAYTLLDAALYYKPSKGNMQLALNVGNLTNTTYWTGAQTYLRLFPGAPRNIMLSTTYKF